MPFHAIGAPAQGVSESSLVDLSTDVLGAPVALVDHGDARTHVNFLFLPEGYTEEELPQFHEQAARFASGLSQIAGYSDHWDEVNVYYQDVRSKSSGIADPTRPDATRSTAFEATFGDGVSSPQRCILPSHRVSAAAIASAHAIARKVAADQIVIVANTSVYGGCAIPADRIAVISANDAAIRIVAHEVGHSLFKLADEYAYNPPTCDVARWKRGTANVSSDLAALPWQDLIPDGTTLPSGPNDAATPIGAFEGAGYCATGAYRPSDKCMMNLLADSFCPVCRREIDRYFAKRTGAGPINDVRVRNASGAGLFVGCDGTTSETCSQLTYIAAGKTALIHTQDGSMILDNQTVPNAPVAMSFQHVTAATADVTVSADATHPLR